MQVRHKIALSVIPLLLLAIVTMNLFFGAFFKRHVEHHEKEQIDVMLASLSSFFANYEGGPVLDKSVVRTIEEITGCTLAGVRADTDGSLAPAEDEDENANAGVVLAGSALLPGRDAYALTVAVPARGRLRPALVLEMKMPRTSFISSMEEVRIFAVLNTLGFFAISAMILWHIRLIITRPIRRLIMDIIDVDISKKELGRLPMHGKDEFSFIRNSVNELLDEIEAYQSRLVESREELHATLTSVGDGVITVDNKARVTFMNPIAQKITGWTREEALGRPIGEVFNIVGEYDREPVDSPVLAVFRRDEIVELSNHTLLLSKDGREIPIEDTAAPIKDSAGVTKGCVLVFRDFSERREKQRRIEYLSVHDQLTGLYNRRYFEDELRNLDRAQAYPVSVIYADVNGLKIINDAFGHENGDRVIQWVAEVFSAVCPRETVARIGGDEFVILLPDTGREGVQKIVERLQFQTAGMAYFDVDLSISYGWDTKESAAVSAFTVLKNAEDLMYRKKLLANSSNRHSVVKSILNTLHVKCPREEAHSRRMRDLCQSIGSVCRLNPDQLKELVTAGELHDIGKIAIDEAILEKTGTLTENEWAAIRRHPETGYRLLSATNEFVALAETVLSHHERWDGNGYPRGLAGEDIDWKARVIAIADAYDAMTSNRPYRKALGAETAAGEIRRGAGAQFDPDLARLFIEEVLRLPWK